MEGFIDIFECEDKSGKKPHFKGYIKINGENHEFAVWPSQKHRGYSGKYKPKVERSPKDGDDQPKGDFSDRTIPF